MLIGGVHSVCIDTILEECSVLSILLTIKDPCRETAMTPFTCQNIPSTPSWSGHSIIWPISHLGRPTVLAHEVRSNSEVFFSTLNKLQRIDIVQGFFLLLFTHTTWGHKVLLSLIIPQCFLHSETYEKGLSSFHSSIHPKLWVPHRKTPRVFLLFRDDLKRRGHHALSFPEHLPMISLSTLCGSNGGIRVSMCIQHFCKHPVTEWDLHLVF